MSVTSAPDDRCHRCACGSCVRGRANWTRANGPLAGATEEQTLGDGSGSYEVYVTRLRRYSTLNTIGVGHMARSTHDVCIRRCPCGALHRPPRTGEQLTGRVCRFCLHRSSTDGSMSQQTQCGVGHDPLPGRDRDASVPRDSRTRTADHPPRWRHHRCERYAWSAAADTADRYSGWLNEHRLHRGHR